VGPNADLDPPSPMHMEFRVWHVGVLEVTDLNEAEDGVFNSGLGFRVSRFRV
jgi:hypothetical protein